jgi:rfaE bifunctional protein nucleotidyltransferase chain/domain
VTDTAAVTHTGRKIMPSASAASDALTGARAADQTIVLTNGVFDLLHAGHVRYLQEARAQGDLLVVGMNGDDSVRRRKGPSRPLVPLEDRMAVVAALACVDLVVPFHEDLASEIVARLRPDVYVKGGDYDPAAPPGAPGYLPEAAVCRGYGGRVAVLSFLPGRSTTELVRRITARPEAR